MARAAGLIAAATMIMTGCFSAPGIDETGPVVQTNGPLWFPNDAANDTRGTDEYWFVLVRGKEEVEPVDQTEGDRIARCQAEWLYRFDEDEKSLTYNARAARIDESDLMTIVVLDFFGVEFGSRSYTGQCPTLYSVKGFNGTARVSATFEHYGSAEMQVFPQGVIGIPNVAVLPLGWGLGYEYTRLASTHNNEYWVFGEWRVENLGAWPKDRLQSLAG